MYLTVDYANEELKIRKAQVLLDNAVPGSCIKLLTTHSVDYLE